MAAQFEKTFVQDLTQDIRIRQCGTIVFNGDNESNIISVDLYNGQEEYSGGGTVVGACICPDGSTVPLTGSISGKTASVVLTSDCFAFPGQIGIGVQIVSGEIKTTVLKAIYNVELFETDTVIDPGSRITLSVTDLIQDINDALANIPASDTNLKAAMAPVFSTSTAYQSGEYAWYEGQLYVFTADHAAGTWVGTDAALAGLGDGIHQLETSVSEINSELDQIDETLDDVQEDDAKIRSSVAPIFSASSAYNAGDYVWYEGQLYKFTADHAAGSWTGTDVVQAVVSSDLADVIGNLNSTQESIKNGTGASTGAAVLSFRAGGYYQTADNTSINGVWKPSKGYVGLKIPCTEGDTFTIKVYGTAGSTRAWAFYDSDNVLKRRALSGLHEETITAMTGDAYVIINNRLENLPAGYYAFTGNTVQAQIATAIAGKQDTLTFDPAPTANSTNPVTSGGVKIALSAIDSQISEIDESIGRADGNALTKTSQSDSYWNAEGTTAVLTSINNWTADTVSVNAGDYVHVHIRGETSTKQWPVLAVDDDLTIINHYGERTQTVQDLYIVIPDGATKLLLTHYTSQGGITQVYPYPLNSVIDMIASIDTVADYRGCKLSLLGDSFSAFAGYSTGNHNYYPTTASDVSNVNQMWWKIVADYFGMTPLVIGAWSGSPVTDGARAGWSGTVASDASRCEALDDGTNNPDVVLIAMGVNDYSYMADASQFGTWDGTTALGSETDLSDYNNTTFKTAYATMIARIQKKYPDAFIICITPWFQKRRTTDTGANYLNSIGKSITDYADAVREVCGIMHVSCIEGTNIGFNRRNYYPTYCQDTATQSTHPNIAGQAQIAKAVIAQMRTLHRIGA